MQGQRIIDRVYFIVHPAHSLGVGREDERDSKEAVEFFFERVLKPLVKRAQSEPGVLVVFVKSPVFPEEDIQRWPHNFSKLGLEQMEKIENAFEKFVLHMMKQRAIIPTEFRFEESAREMKVIMGQRRFVFSEKPVLESYGSRREICAKLAPRFFVPITFRPNARIVVPIHGTIAMQHRFRRRR